MRSDMSKVISDCYRHGHRMVPKFGRPPRDLDSLPAREGIRRRYHEGWARAMKESSYNGNPFRRFLQKQVGRPWDAIFSEICKEFDVRKPTNRRIFELVDRYVTQTNLRVEGGKVIEAPPYMEPCEASGLYVHPVTGILLYADGRNYRFHYKKLQAERRAEAAALERDISANEKLMKIEGQWYVVQFAAVTPPRVMEVRRWKDSLGRAHVREHIDPQSVCYDVLTGVKFTAEFIQENPRKKTYAKTKRQASHRELKQYGII